MDMLSSRHITHVATKRLAMFLFQALIICLTCQNLSRYAGEMASVKMRHFVIAITLLLDMYPLKLYGLWPSSCGFSTVL
jgi:hypothetical protein